eukprot:TRINITY_DN3706_c0_g1_i1.p1 TRINITY_DN3706_c0_g1~~TRINITY_DN3706_c0_g1_i1.p1  ORF type:complete len:121 (+),score=8.73 TRINITY_DN3706_c0_g1_i1:24-365(+)
MRLHAAECITLLITIYRQHSASLDFDLEEDAGVAVDDLIDLFRGLSGDRRSAPKKELTSQRKKFRILLETLDKNLNRRYASTSVRRNVSFLALVMSYRWNAFGELYVRGFRSI